MAIQSGKSYSAGAFALEIDGTFAGILGSVEGGGVHGDVVDEPPGADGVVHKHLGEVGYDDIVVTSALPSGDWADWLKAFLAGKAPQHDGAVIFLNYQYVAVRRLEFRRATIASLTFPRLDGSAKTSGSLTVALRPESTVTVAASGSTNPSPMKLKGWTTSNFVIDIPGVDCSRVGSVEPLTVSQDVIEDPVGGVRTPTRQAGPLRVGDLVLNVALSHAADFASWSEDFIVRGNNGAADEKTATVHLKTPNFKDDVFSISLKGLGIHHFEAEKQVHNAESIARMTASMYCEEVALVLPKPADPVGGGPAPATPPPPDQPTGSRPRLGDLGERLAPADVARRLQGTAETEAPGSADGPRATRRPAGRGVGAADGVARRARPGRRDRPRRLDRGRAG